jgi:hypothetical protein
MPAGLPYFAWIDVSEITFGSEHLRWDESVFSFTLAQEEGDPATLTAIVRRPQNEAGNTIGLLGPGRKIWCWFAFDCGPALVKFRGRLVGIPTSLFEDLVTLEFVAKPIDVVAQKAALADTLRVLPFYDEAVIDPQRHTDPDLVLEGYTKIWHFNPETHVITVSDEISGEDGLVEFDGVSDTGKVLYDGLGLNLTSGPLARVDINAEYTWTQRARGTVDLTGYLIGNWPGQINGAIQLNAGDWPKPGTGLGDGWQVADSTAVELHKFTVRTETRSQEFVVRFGEGNSGGATITESISHLGAPVEFNPGDTNWIITNEQSSSTFGADGAASSISHSLSASRPGIGVQEIKATLVAEYSAERQCTERVSLTLIADVQPILTDPEDSEALRIDDIRSVNLSDDLALIGDQRRRSYIATERGNRSIEHLIVLARAHLMKRARAIEITFAPKLERMPEITLRKNAFLVEPRVGEALGKIIAYSIALDGRDGRVKCEVRMGCTIGRGGVAAAADGDPTYCTVDYTGSDYQQFINRTVLFLIDSSVGYQPPNADPNDDGINFLSGPTVMDVIEVPLSVVRGSAADEGQEPPSNSGGSGGTTSEDNIRSLIEARQEWIKNVYLKQYETRATFKLKSMTREFATDYVLQVTDLKIPTGYNLEAV